MDSPERTVYNFDPGNKTDLYGKLGFSFISLIFGLDPQRGLFTVLYPNVELLTAIIYQIRVVQDDGTPKYRYDRFS